MNQPRRRVRFRPCANFYIYIAAVLLAAIFTQALRSPLSAMLYVFLIIIPFASLITLFVNSAAVTVYLGSGQESVRRYEPVEVTLKLVNGSFIPQTVVEAQLLIPQKNGLPSDRIIAMPLAPYGSYSLSGELSFDYRGEYGIGVICVYVRDMAGMFRLRADVDSYTAVYVLPRRRYLLRQAELSDGDSPIGAVKSSENTGQSDVRDYIPGDSLRNIHWKLSSKSDSGLLVREYSSPVSGNLYVICDLAGGVNDSGGLFTFSDDAEVYSLNETVEAALAVAYNCLDRGGCTALWYSVNGVNSSRIASRADYEALYGSLTSAQVTDEPDSLTYLLGQISGDADITVVSSECGGRMINALSLSESPRRLSLCLIDKAPEIIGGMEEYTRYVNDCRARLANLSVTVYTPQYGE